MRIAWLIAFLTAWASFILAGWRWALLVDAAGAMLFWLAVVVLVLVIQIFILVWDRKRD